MLPAMNDMDAIIRALGGTKEAAALFRVTQPAISNWKADGRFPRSRRYEALLLLQERGIAFDPKVFEDAANAA